MKVLGDSCCAYWENWVVQLDGQGVDALEGVNRLIVPDNKMAIFGEALRPQLCRQIFLSQ